MKRLHHIAGFFLYIHSPERKVVVNVVIHKRVIPLKGRIAED